MCVINFQEELERFIPFMTKCSLNKGKAKVVNGRPEWWPMPIRYSFPLKKPRGLSDLGYIRHLQSIVCKCYCYHNAHFLLSFSSMFYNNPLSIFMRINDNNTTSVFSFENEFKELFTFDNEDKVCDVAYMCGCWLVGLGAKDVLFQDYDQDEDEGSDSMSVVPESSTPDDGKPDIYLCENCDVEFYSYEDIKSHEQQCFDSQTQNDSADESMEEGDHDEPVPQLHEQHNFLSTFGLQSKADGQQSFSLDLSLPPVPQSLEQAILDGNYELDDDTEPESGNESVHESTLESSLESALDSSMDSLGVSPMDTSVDSLPQSAVDTTVDSMPQPSFSGHFNSSFQSSPQPGTSTQSDSANLPDSTVQADSALLYDSASDDNSPSSSIRRWLRMNMCLQKNKKIEFSSAIGRKMLDNGMKQDVMGSPEKSLQGTEMYCGTGQRPYRESRDSSRPRVTYRTNKRSEWAHSYSFSKRQKIEKIKVLKTGKE